MFIIKILDYQNRLHKYVGVFPSYERAEEWIKIDTEIQNDIRITLAENKQRREAYRHRFIYHIIKLHEVSETNNNVPPNSRRIFKSSKQAPK